MVSCVSLCVSCSLDDYLTTFFQHSLRALLATVEMRSNDPNPWKRSKPFSHLLSSLFFGKYLVGPQTIAAHENVNEIQASETKWGNRLREAEEKANQRSLEYYKQQEEYYKELEELGDAGDDISTKIGGFSIDPTKQYLLPIQEWLGIICDILRITKNIVIWEECYISFWIAIGSFILAVAFYFVPWAFLIGWTLRIFVWFVFGPHMKLVDVFYFSKLESETEDQKKARESQQKSERDKWWASQKRERHIAREKATKLKDFKQYLFGEFVSKVNVLKRDRFYDIPLPASSAQPYNPGWQSLGELAMEEAGYHRNRVNGQQLVGDMIPQVGQCVVYVLLLVGLYLTHADVPF
jgi:hypothetical protein